MKLSEKIFSCRKKAGLSQEQLAEQIGVSRQAVSKWESADAEPDIRKLRLLAGAFGVSIDWLLSEEDPAEEPAPDPVDQTPPQSNWVQSIPGMLGKLFRRYGWLAGVYMAITGAGIALIGGLARVASRAMFFSFANMSNGMFDSFSSCAVPGDVVFYDAYGNVMGGSFASPFGGSLSPFAQSNPVSILGTAFLVVGLVLILAGVVLAIVLKKKSRA